MEKTEEFRYPFFGCLFIYILLLLYTKTPKGAMLFGWFVPKNLHKAYLRVSWYYCYHDYHHIFILNNNQKVFCSFGCSFWRFFEGFFSGLLGLIPFSWVF